MKGLLIHGFLIFVCWGIAAEEQAEKPRRLALLVGVGNYSDSKIPSLNGPVNDVSHMESLLTTADGYGFSKENVLTLRDQQATLDRFQKLFQEHLVLGSRSRDVVLIYFSGRLAKAGRKRG